MLLLDVGVIASSWINSLWVLVYKITISFLHYGHKPFTWWYGTLVANIVYQESHCQSEKGHTDMIDIYHPYGRTNGRQYDSLGVHRIMPMQLIVCPGMNWELHVLQPFLSCCLLQNLTGCTLHPHILGVAAVNMMTSSNGNIFRSPVNSPHKGQWRGALMFSLICVWINGWVNNREAGDLRRYRAHYDVIVIKMEYWC